MGSTIRGVSFAQLSASGSQLGGVTVTECARAESGTRLTRSLGSGILRQELG